MRWVWDLREQPPSVAGPPGLEIRLVPVQGISVAAGIMAETWKGYVTRAQAGDFLRRAQGQGRLLPFVAYLEGHPVASSLVVIRGRLAQLYGGVHVYSDYRRRGIGAALLRAAIRHVRGLGQVTHLWVAREISDPPTADDLAAMALYDRMGGIRRTPLVEVVYSPQCPWSADWVNGFREEVQGLDAEFRAYDLYAEPAKAWALLNGTRLVAGPRPAEPGPAPLLENVLARVFVDGEMVEGGPYPPPGALATVVGTNLGLGTSLGAAAGSAAVGGRIPGAFFAAGDAAGGEPAPRPAGGPSAAEPAGPAPGAASAKVPPCVADYPASLEGLRREPLTVAGAAPALAMCLGRHPSGSKPRPPAAAEGSETKRRWLHSLALPGGFLGVAAWRGEQVVGLLEVYPRDIASRAGYVTGTWGAEDSSRILTVTCLEAARGERRQPVLEFLLEGLLVELEAGRSSGRLPYDHVEALGVYGDPAGPSPYWLYEKYGFTRREERRPGASAILSRAV